MPVTQTFTDFWDHHGIFFLIFITFFPRLTLLFSSVPFGGLFWWFGFVIAPRILVAILATVTYFSSNPVLVIIAWVVALSGESGEKYYVKNRVRTSGFTRRGPATNADVIDANFKRID